MQGRATHNAHGARLDHLGAEVACADAMGVVHTLLIYKGTPSFLGFGSARRQAGAVGVACSSI